MNTTTVILITLFLLIINIGITIRNYFGDTRESKIVFGFGCFVIGFMSFAILSIISKI